MAAKTVGFAPVNGSFKQEFPRIWEYRYGDRKELSHWSKHEIPLTQLIGKLDTDHWTKLKRRHLLFYNSMDSRSKMNHISVNDLPKPHGGIQQHYYDQSRNREYLLQEGRTMYSLPDVHSNRNKTTRKQPSIYNQHAKNGFKFWMEILMLKRYHYVPSIHLVPSTLYMDWVMHLETKQETTVE